MRRLEITKDTRISDILIEYGDIAEVMELFGIKRVGRYSLRMFLAKALTVEWAARVHHVPVEQFLEVLQRAVELAPEGTRQAKALSPGEE